MDAVGWAAFGVAATLLAAFVAHRVGYLQFGQLRQANDLSRRLASPKIASSIRVAKRFDNGSHFPPWFYLQTTLSNQGELAAQDLKGEWKLSCPTHEIAERTIPIHQDWLGNTQPYALEECRLESGIGGGVWTSRGAQSGGPQFSVTIELAYRGLKDEIEHYTARYEYDSNREQMVRAA